MTNEAQSRFRPAAPAREDRLRPIWRLFFGEMSRNALVGWPKFAFERDYWFRRVITLRTHLISDPEAIGRVLLDNAANYPKPPLVKRMLRNLTGEGLLTSDGEPWREQRRLMAPVFTPGAVAHFMPLFVEAAKATADRWTPGRIDVAAETTRTTAQVISRALFSDEPSLTSAQASEHMHAALAAVGEYRLGVLIGMPWLDRSPIARRGEIGRKFILARLTEFVARRQADPDPPPDFMTRLLQAFGEGRSPAAAAKLALDNAVTFYIAGHETTANALAWSLYLMSQDQAVQDRAAAEARAAFAAGGGPEEVVARLPYLRMVLEEAMRLYPPVVRIDRVALAEDELCGHRIRKGDMVSIWPWVLHRHTRLWEEPDLFNPENFSPQAKAGRNRFQYLPFGAGPRVCIGAQFAQAEAALILSCWLARFQFAPVLDHEVFPTADVAIRPRGGLPLMVSLRETDLIAAA
ncbi:MAG: cytochrome P450 [Pseudomonadota bacterium]|uniref:cytochrome P450 n=1 Tax=Phenylobacterium sp. TaxID=1871053 RepID=UPI0025E59E08|nr:cytochrome P450 [Phenylobacterium sp.]MBT9472983.1 cytochrome P450 [Phenylobacterium sp.]